MTTQPACVLFSGGADSTLAASLMAEQFGPVHLLSFKHRHMAQLEKTTASAHHLQERMKGTRFIHRWIDLSDLWTRLLHAPHSGEMKPSRLFSLLLKPCLACKAAMHLLTLAYCRENNIGTAADGAHPSGANLFPEQLPQGLEIIRAFYQRYGVVYLNPALLIDRPDEELFRRGVTMKKNTKSEHLYYSNQFSCHVGVLAYLHHFLSWPLDKKKEKVLRRSMIFLADSLGRGEKSDGEWVGAGSKSGG